MCVKKKIFTLIELLIVVSIIAILAGLLLPVLKKAQDKAKQIGCISNMKQAGTVEAFYENDYKGFVPLAYNKSQNNNVPFYILYINGYIAGGFHSATSKKAITPKIYDCPGDPTRKTGIAGGYQIARYLLINDSPAVYANRAVVYNNALGYYYDNKYYPPYAPSRNKTSPSKVPVIADFDGYSTGSTPYNYGYHKITNGTFKTYFEFTHHNFSVNILTAAGNVVPFKGIIDYRDTKVWSGPDGSNLLITK